MDIKDIIARITDKAEKDDDFKTSFMSDPVKAIEKITGIDLPDDQINAIIDAVKAKIVGNVVKNQAGNLLDKAKDLLGK